MSVASFIGDTARESLILLREFRKLVRAYRRRIARTGLNGEPLTASGLDASDPLASTYEQLRKLAADGGDLAAGLDPTPHLQPGESIDPTTGALIEAPVVAEAGCEACEAPTPGAPTT